MLPVILLVVLFFALQLLCTFLLCCGGEMISYSQFLSDEEQVEYRRIRKKNMDINNL